MEEAEADAEQERLETRGVETKEGLEQQRLEKEDMEKQHVAFAAKPNVDEAAAPYSIPLQLISAPRIPPHRVVLFFITLLHMCSCRFTKRGYPGVMLPSLSRHLLCWL